ncbi:SDR family NAD(P)-dependent oxidoreductase [Amycolatopsis methanolica]|uniref:SDR family NAD(P)-dependent oxidoreductase n=1 Tax=Amycolatopsis methanolica TaxID=1814 RepID=UPI002265DF72|nr:SDR family NAD(P)-dependent oxidoreductase [Amycolatopsis methanolica]
MTRTERVWLITGCSAGFGRELVRAAVAAGDRVMATARRPEQLAGLAGDRVRTHALDVTDPAQVEEAVQATLREFGASTLHDGRVAVGDGGDVLRRGRGHQGGGAAPA